MSLFSYLKSIFNWRPFYETNPTYITKETKDNYWEEKIDSNFSKAIVELKGIQSSLSLIVIQKGKLINETYFHGSEINHANNIHSASKSIIGALVGILIKQKKLSLDDTLEKLLPEYNLHKMPQGKITLKNLLTMTSGLKWVEDESEYQLQFKVNWVSAILNLKLESEPGKEFNYSTACSHLVSVIIQSVTGKTTQQYAQEVLFTPMGIEIPHMGHDPQGVTSGGYNCYMTPRSLAKFAQLYSNCGFLGHDSIVPPQWTYQSLAPQVDTGFDPKEEDFHYFYGYFWWLTTIGEFRVKKMWGFGGQLAYLIPDLDAIVVLTNDTKKFYKEEMDGDNFIKEFILPYLKPVVDEGSYACPLCGSFVKQSQEEWVCSNENCKSRE